MSVEEELKKDHSDMQAVVDSKQKVIEAQVPKASVATATLHGDASRSAVSSMTRFTRLNDGTVIASNGATYERGSSELIKTPPQKVKSEKNMIMR